MVNLAINACSTDSEKKTLLDPMCGKGTTLFEGIIRGMNVVGTEVQSASFADLQAFLIKYLKTGRFKHRIRREKRSDSNGKKFADFFYVETAATKEAFADDNKLTLQVYCADTRRLPELVKKQCCDMLVCDLPYGVQHGSKTASTGRLSRSPAELLEDSIAGWVNSMKSGASIVLSFNEFTLKWDVAKEILENAGLTVKAEAPFAGYLHRVDQSINRNIICAVKP
nr:hypothetical protein [Pseudovibrio flavus]